MNPDRKWQERVAKILHPHFEVKHVSYEEYDTILGPVRAIFNIPLLLAAIVVFFVSIYCVTISDLRDSFYCLFVFIVIFILSAIGAGLLREDTTKKIKSFVSKYDPYGQPHVVAHSLGTYLIGNALKKYPDLQFGNVLLISSVLPYTYPWAEILSSRPHAVQNVRNEYGTADFVTKLVGFIQFLARDMGASGSCGFKERDGVVHNSDTPLSECPICAIQPAKIHNIPLRDFGHSDEFIGVGHARAMWLPFFWNISPVEFQIYIKDCRSIAELLKVKQYRKAGLLTDQFRERHFSFSNEGPLDAYIYDFATLWLAKEGLPVNNIDDLVDEIFSRLPTITEQAVYALREENQYLDTAVNLHPAIAIMVATGLAIDDRRAGLVDK